VTAIIRTLPTRTSIDGMGRNEYSAGDFAPFKDRAHAFHPRWLGVAALWAIGDRFVADAFNSCAYYDWDRPDPRSYDPRVAWAPGCPPEEQTIPPDTWTNTGTGTTRGGFDLISTDLGAPRGLGGWYVSAADVRNSGAVGL